MEEDKKEEIEIVKVTVSVSHQILHLNLPRKRLTT